MSWTDESIYRLRGMWPRGMTASQIAEELGAVSRNAVIGKAHRLGLQSRPSPVKPNEPVAGKAQPEVVDESPFEEAPAPEAKPTPAPEPVAEEVDVVEAAPKAQPAQPRIVSV